MVQQSVRQQGLVVDVSRGVGVGGQSWGVVRDGHGWGMGVRVGRGMVGNDGSRGMGVGGHGSWNVVGNGHSWGVVGNGDGRGVVGNDGWGVGLDNWGNGLDDGDIRGLAHDGVESVDGVGGVVDGAAGAIGFNQGVLS